MLAVLPALLYFPCDPLPCLWFVQVATISMVPLLKRDELLLATVALVIMYILLFRVIVGLTARRVFAGKVHIYDFLSMSSLCTNNEIVILLGNFCYIDAFVYIVVAQCVIPPPARFPHIFDLLISVYCCAHFVLFYVYFTLRQLYGFCDHDTIHEHDKTEKPSSKRAKKLQKRYAQKSK